MSTTAPYSLGPPAKNNWQQVTVEANIQKALNETVGMDAAQKMLCFLTK